MKILNSKLPITNRNEIFPNTTDVRNQLLDYASQLDICVAVGEIHKMNVGRLMSLIHAFTGEIPTVCSATETDDRTDDQDSSLVLTETQNPVSKR